MINIITIDVDTERTPQIKFTKPDNGNPPKNKEELLTMLSIDIASLSYALNELIERASVDNEQLKLELIEMVFKNIKGV